MESQLAHVNHKFERLYGPASHAGLDLYGRSIHMGEPKTRLGEVGKIRSGIAPSYVTSTRLRCGGWAFLDPRIDFIPSTFSFKISFFFFFLFFFFRALRKWLLWCLLRVDAL